MTAVGVAKDLETCIGTIGETAPYNRLTVVNRSGHEAAAKNIWT